METFKDGFRYLFKQCEHSVLLKNIIKNEIIILVNRTNGTIKIEYTGETEEGIGNCILKIQTKIYDLFDKYLYNEIFAQLDKEGYITEDIAKESVIAILNINITSREENSILV